jgi:hypothetical protein
MTTRPTLSRRSTVVLLCAIVLAIPAWIGLVGWLDTVASDWATLAPHYAAGALRPLECGSALPVLQRLGGTARKLRWQRVRSLHHP